MAYRESKKTTVILKKTWIRCYVRVLSQGNILNVSYGCDLMIGADGVGTGIVMIARRYVTH